MDCCRIRRGMLLSRTQVVRRDDSLTRSGDVLHFGLLRIRSGEYTAQTDSLALTVNEA